MPERIKLQNPGEEVTFAVTGVSKEDIENNEYFLITDGKRELLIPAKSVDRQLDRVGVSTAHQLVGHTIRISRSTELSKFGKPYWNLDPAKGNGSPASQPGPHQAQPEHTERVALRTAYLGLTKWVLDEVAPLYEKAGIGMSPESAAACVATLLIQAAKSGKIE